MKKKILIFLIVVSLLFISSIKQSTGWPATKIYVQKVDVAPKIDGEFTSNEWKTSEEKFQDKLSGLTYLDGNAKAVSMKLTLLRDDNFLYAKIEYQTTIDDLQDNISIGIALSTVKGDDSTMDDYVDRKIAFHDASTNNVTTYDLYSCTLAACDTARSLRPGIDDDQNDVIASFGKSDNNPAFEFKISLAGDGSFQDIPIQDGTHLRIVTNPYSNIYKNTGGHGAIASGDLELTFSPRPFFERPAGPMDSLSIFFNSVFALIIVGASLAIFLSARNENLARKLWRVYITEEMANKSLIMEIGYYNSSFLAMFALFYFWAYSIIGLFYSYWANWGFTGFLILGIPALMSTITMVDLIIRNKNPQDDKENKVDLGPDIEETGGLWILPPIFLALVLFMLVFIGIDVIS